MTTRQERISDSRRDKLERLRSAGINPYPNRFHRTYTAAEAVNLLKQIEDGTTADDQVTVAGRITARRLMGKGAFFDIRDGSGKIQLFFHNINQFESNNLEVFNALDIGDFIGVSGKIMRTRSNEPTVRAEEFTLLAKSFMPLPEKWHGLSDVEKRYRQRYLDLIANSEAREIFLIRSKTITAIRHFLDERGFLEVETPILQGEAGGALAKPFITHHNALDQDFYLRIALELHLKRLIVGGFDKVYEIGRVFRNEGISTTHSPEYTLLESYEAYADYQNVMEMTEQMVYQVSLQVLEKAEVRYGDDTINLTPPWQRITLRDAVKEYSGIDFVKYPTASGLREKMSSLNIETDPAKNWAKLVDELYKTFARPKIIQPAFLLDYPVSMSPLAKNKPGEERVVERFQAVAGGLEIANAYSELNDPVEQRKRFEEQMKERQTGDDEVWSIDEDFLLALEHGMPPTGGLGVGVDRLVMLLTNQQSIREVILFPHTREKGQ
jgi:lysyl-tRNA synthetase class 2